MGQKYVECEDVFDDMNGKIWICLNCGGLVLGFVNSKIGEREHKRCPPRPVQPYADEVKEE